MESKYSIIVPIYNVEEYLEECIESLINQTYTNIEIVLVNDGTKDNSGKICEKYEKTDPRIKYIIKKNGGLSSARNEGLKHATGDYIIFVDSDDYISTKLCEKINTIIVKEKADLIQYEFKKFIDGEENVVEKNNNTEIIGIYNHENYYENYLIKENIKREAWSKVYKKSLFKKIRYPEGRIAEDLATTYKILDEAKKIVCISDELYFYRIRKNSIMSKGSTKLYHDAMIAHYEIYENSINKGKKYESRAYSNYFNNLMKLYSKSFVENDKTYIDAIEKRYRIIEKRKLNFKSKIVYLISRINKKIILELIYKKYVK